MNRLQPLTIGSCRVDMPVLLAPMAGVSDLAFRLLCREMGAGLVCTEMVSVKAIFYGNRGTKELMESRSEERPLALQLFGSDPELMGDIAAQVEDGPWLSGAESGEKRRRLRPVERSGKDRENRFRDDKGGEEAGDREDTQRV